MIAMGTTGPAFHDRVLDAVDEAFAESVKAEAGATVANLIGGLDPQSGKRLTANDVVTHYRDALKVTLGLHDAVREATKAELELARKVS